MVKTGVFKKIAALTAAVAIVASFALCASAAEVQTTTQYVNGTEINVIANVTDAGGGNQVTYYATNGSKKVYIDQTTANADGVATFNYVTNVANLKSNVLVGHTNAGEPTESDVTGYTITGTGITALNVPTANINGTHVLDYELEEGKIVTGVTATGGATVSGFDYAGGNLTVVLAGATGDVELTVATADKTASAATIEFVTAAMVVSTDEEDDVIEIDPLNPDADVQAKPGDRKLTVFAKVTGAEEYGILVSEEAIASGTASKLNANIAYEALGKNDSGYFAVQLIDTNSDGADALLQSGKDYYTAVYCKDPATNVYYITAGQTPVKAN